MSPTQYQDVPVNDRSLFHPVSKKLPEGETFRLETNVSVLLGGTKEE